MKRQNLTVYYAFVQGFYWMGFAVIMGFGSFYLLNSGFNNTQIGIIIAVAGILSAALQPVIAGYADRPDSISLKQFVVIVGIAILICAIGLIFFQGIIFLTSLFYGCCIALLQIATPLVNSLGVVGEDESVRLNYGIARGIGSVAYAVVAYGLGSLADYFGTIAVPVVMAFSFFLLILAVWRYPFRQFQVVKEKGEQKSGLGPLEFFRKYSRFGLVLLGTTMLYVSHVLLNSFTFQIVQSKGGGSAEMGVVIGLAAVMELPTMFFFSFMQKRVRCDIWFRISAVFFMLKTLGTLLCPSIGTFYGIQLLQMFGWGLITVSSVFYVNSIMEAEDTIKGQAYFTMTYTLGSVIGAAVGGSMIDYFGVSEMLMFATACSVIGMVMVLSFARPKIPQGKRTSLCAIK